jgi:hypothetical protein
MTKSLISLCSFHYDLPIGPHSLSPSIKFQSPFFSDLSCNCSDLDSTDHTVFILQDNVKQLLGLSDPHGGFFLLEYRIKEWAPQNRYIACTI